MRSGLTLIMMIEGPSWSVQCLELDIAAQGDTVAEALKDFAATFDAERKINNIWGAPKAPVCYWNTLRDKLCEECERTTP